MSTQDELFAEYGRPEAYPPGKALGLLDPGAVSGVDPDDVQAFRYYSNDMALAFTNGGQSEPGRRFLGFADDPDQPGYRVAAFELTGGDAQALADQNISNEQFRAQ